MTITATMCPSQAHIPAVHEATNAPVVFKIDAGINNESVHEYTVALLGAFLLTNRGECKSWTRRNRVCRQEQKSGIERTLF